MAPNAMYNWFRFRLIALGITNVKVPVQRFTKAKGLIRKCLLYQDNDITDFQYFTKRCKIDDL